jgi:hypothetical protein
MAHASTPPLAPEPANNPSASAVQPSAGTGAGVSVSEVEHTASGVFEVSLEGLGASAQDIEALRRIQALIAGKAVAAQQEQEVRPSSSQAQPSQQQGMAPTHAAPDAVDFNITQARRYLALLQSQIAGTMPQQHAIPTPVAPAPAAAAQATPVSQQHVWHTLHAMQAQLDQWRQQKDASEGQSIGHRQERGQVLEHFVPDDIPFRNIVPVSPLSVELESALWSHRFNANTLPQYDEDYDSKEFLMKFEAVVESNGGNATMKATALVMALNGEVQYWYANIPKGHITSWFQLRNKLLSSLKGMQVEELDSNDLVNMCIQGDRESLQEYMHVVKLTARAPGVSESSTIDAIVGGLRVGNCQDVLDRIKPKPLQELFEVMQEYCKSGKGRRRRLDRANVAKKQKQLGQWDPPRGWQNHPPKHAHRQVNNVSAPPDQNQNRNGSGHKGGHKNGRGQKPQQPHPPPQGCGGKFFCWLHGINAYHHTHHCPSTIKKKMEWEAEEKAKAAGLAVNHIMKCQNP